MNNILFIKETIPSILLLYLLITSNYLGEIFNCSFIRTLQQNIYIKNILAFLSLYFCIIIVAKFYGNNKVSRYLNDMSPLNRLWLSSILYIIFILTTRCDYKYLFIVILLFSTLLIIELQEDYMIKRGLLDYNIKNKVSGIKTVITLSSIFFLLFGFIIYYMKRYEEYKDVWSLHNFLLGKYENKNKGTCKNTVKKVDTFKSDIYYFKKLFN